MAIPTYAQVLAQINTYIVANGNNEITANVLNPILKIITDFTNNNIGDLADLTTTEKNTIVAAINSLKLLIDGINDTGVQLYEDINDPNITPPPTYNYADFYMQLDIDSLPVKLWQWNGFVWTDASQEAATSSDNVQNNSNVTGTTVTEALNALRAVPIGLEILATAGQTVLDIGSTALVRMVIYNLVPLQKSNWSQTGTNITLTFAADLNDLFQFI